MKKHLSVFMLISRSTIYKVIALFVAMAALEGALFYISLDKALTRPIAENSVGLQATGVTELTGSTTCRPRVPFHKEFNPMGIRSYVSATYSIAMSHGVRIW